MTQLTLNIVEKPREVCICDPNVVIKNFAILVAVYYH